LSPYWCWLPRAYSSRIELSRALSAAEFSV
jgi:hypothetical protein